MMNFFALLVLLFVCSTGANTALPDANAEPKTSSQFPRRASQTNNDDNYRASGWIAYTAQTTSEERFCRRSNTGVYKCSIIELLVGESEKLSGVYTASLGK